MAGKSDGSKGVELKKDGLHVGDFVIGVAPRRSTDDDLDGPQERDRARQKLEDERAAQHSGNAAPGGPPSDAAAQATADVDASIEAAREAQNAREEPPFPILLRDPITGEIIGKTGE